MAWNGPPNFNNHASVPFWDFMAALDPNRARGAGVDHAAPEFPGVNFGPGFPFGPGGFPGGYPGGFEGFGRRRGGPWRHWGGEDWAEGPWGRRGSCRGARRFRHGFPGFGGEEPEQPPQYTDDEQQQRAAPASGEEEDKEMGGVNEKQDSPATMRDETADPPEEIPDPREGRRGHHGHHGRHGGRRGRGGFGGFRGGPHGPPHHGPGFGPGPHHHHGPPPPPPFGPHGASGFPFDFTPLIQAFATHPYAQQVREYLERAQNAAGGNANTTRRAAAETVDSDENNDSSNEDVESFAPPVDIFDTPTSWVLHIAVPGAKKEDVGVNWDADKSLLGVSGVIYRPGDEAFLQGLVSGERRVGLFSRDVRLPPEGVETKDEVDSAGIAAKLEEGVLIVTVPKVEKEWTEVRKVDIE